MRARIISRLQRERPPEVQMLPRSLNEGQDYIPATTCRRGGRRRVRPRSLNEGQDYIPATTVFGRGACVAYCQRSMRARIISRLQPVRPDGLSAYLFDAQ